MTADRFDLPPYIDAAIPYSGPCGLCGGPEARHRVLDAIVERYRTGESASDIAGDYEKPLAIVEDVCAHWNDKTQEWVA